MPRSKTYRTPAEVSVRSAIAENAGFEWLEKKCQVFALTLPCLYNAESQTFHEEGTIFDQYEIMFRLVHLEDLGRPYWYIVHCDDRYTEKDAPSPDLIGRLKPAHIHIVVDFQREIRASSVLAYFRRWFGTDPDGNMCNPAEYPDIPLFVHEWTDGVPTLKVNPWLSIKPVQNMTGALAYLCHRTPQAKEDGKFVYPVANVQTNDRDMLEGAIRLCEEGRTAITASNLLHFVEVCDGSCSKLVSLLGLKAYQSFRPVIKDLVDEWKARRRW